MNAMQAESALIEKRIPARVVGEGRSWFQLAVFDEWEEKVYGVHVSRSDLSDLLIDWHVACGRRQVCRLQRQDGGLVVTSRSRRAA